MKADKDIIISKVDESWIKILAKEAYMEMDIQDRFSFESPNAQHDPRVRSGRWDGVIKLYNRKTKKFPIGLLYRLVAFIKKKNWSVAIDPALIPSDEQITIEELQEIIEDVIKPHNEKGERIEPYDYQLKSVMTMLNMDRSIQLAATSAGKSLILYITCRILQLMEEFLDKKILICVPTKNLVEQLYNDFKDYSNHGKTGWQVEKYVQKISGDYDKNVNKQIVISTWQSGQKLPPYFYENVNAIFIDETHTAAADVLNKLIASAVNTPIKHGLTGTLDGNECNEMMVEGVLGPPVKIVKAKQLIEKKRATNVIVNIVVLKYSEDDAFKLQEYINSVEPKKRYHAELDFINTFDKRNSLLKGLIESVKGNTLCLFGRVESFGIPLFEAYKKDHQNTFMIHGSIPTEERNIIKKSIEEYNDCRLFASFGTFKMGESVKKLMNMFMLSSYKAKITTLQSIGRMMRLHAEKENAQIYDIVDCFQKGDFVNNTFKHSHERLTYYKSEGFQIKFIELKVK